MRSPWSASSCASRRATTASTRSPTGTPGGPRCPASPEACGDLLRARGRVDPPERRVALDLPAAIPARRAVARDGGHEQRVPAPPPRAPAPARREVRLYVLPGRPVVLPVPCAHRDGRVPD